MRCLTAGLMVWFFGASLAAVADAQTYEPRGLTFGQGGGFRYAPREHHVSFSGGHHSYLWAYGYGWPGAYGFAWPGGYYFGGYSVYDGPLIIGSWNNPVVYQPVYSPGAYWPEPLPMSQIPDSPLVAPPGALPAQGGAWDELPVPKKDNPALRPVLPSSAAARLKSLNYQADGDQNVRQQLWQRAYVNYRQAVNVADDQAMAHLRYGIVFAVLRRYDRAEMEFQRAVYIDPTLPEAEFTLEQLFGPDSQLVRSSIIARIADWVNEDIVDPQRLFVLGVLMHFNQDERAQELFSAARQLTNGAAHVTAFLPRRNPQDKAIAPPPGDEALILPPAPLPAAPLPEPGKRPAKLFVAPPAPKVDENAGQPDPPPQPDGPQLLPPPGE